jgi:hypothetical protein
MKYLITIILALGFAGYAFVKGYSMRDHEDDGIDHPCAPDSILSAKNPDARYSHCRDEDWDGSTILRDRLAEAQARPDLYGILLESNELRRLASQRGLAEGARQYFGMEKRSYERQIEAAVKEKRKET